MSRRGLLAGAALAATVFAAAGGAHATVATVARGVDNWSAAFNSSGYNASYDGFGNRTLGLLGPTQASSPGFNCPACTGSSTGTLTPGVNATASFDQATTKAGTGAIGTAFARANLATGQLGVGATGQAYPIAGFTSSVGGTSLAGLFDDVTFNVAGASPTTVTDIGVTLDLHGTMSGSAFLQEQLLFSSPGVNDANLLLQISGTQFSPPVVSDAQAGGSWVSASFSPLTPGNVVFHGVYALTGASQEVSIGEVLYSEAFAGFADYAHTSDFSLSLPANVSFTSASGVFLSGGVPEPASWALMLTGIGLIGGALRRRARRALAAA